MAHTFLYAIEAEGSSIALKFESSTPTTSRFMVTFLTAPHVAPFVIEQRMGKWRLPEELPAEVRELEAELLEAARKFQR